MAAVRELGEPVGVRLALDEAVQARVLERDRRLRAEPVGELARLVAEVGLARRQVEDAALAAVQAERDRERLAAVVRVALAGDLLAVDDEPGAGGAGRLDRVLDDDREERVRLVGGREGVAEAGDRVAHAAALGVELPQALLELGGHVVEGLARGRRTRRGRGPARAGRSCPWRSPPAAAASSPQRADDRAAERVGEDADGDHGHGREEEEAAAEVADRLVDARPSG